jgi:hypothetical protein
MAFLKARHLSSISLIAAGSPASVSRRQILP